MASSSRHGESSLIWIGAYKLFHGVLLAIVAGGLLKAMHHDPAALVWDVVKAFHFDPGNRHVAALLQKAGLIDGRTLKHLSGLTFAYAAIFMVEGIGLMFRQRWAEYLTVVVTFSLVPLEWYELTRHFTALKLAILIGNIAILIYLIVVIRRKSKSNA